MCQYLLFGSKMLSYSTLLMAFVSTIMIALRDFQYLDMMFEKEPNVTLVFFIFFVISVMLFLGAIFISMVMTIVTALTVMMTAMMFRKDGGPWCPVGIPL